MSTVFNDQNDEIDSNRLTILFSFTVNKNPLLDEEVTNKNYFDELDKDIFSRLIKQYKTISKSPLEIMYIMSQNTKGNNL